MPTEPSFYIHVPTRIDPSAAPAEKDALAVLVPVGHLRDMAINIGIRAQDWPAMVNTARETVIRTVEARTGASLRSHIIHEIVNSPTTWKEKFNLDKGAILGLSHSFFNVLSFRPRSSTLVSDSCISLAPAPSRGQVCRFAWPGASLRVSRSWGTMGCINRGIWSLRRRK
jgi:phytoene dehydrogenase-like protein